MRPEVLFPLFTSIEQLPGIGPKLAGLMARLAGGRVVDLLFHLPVGLTDRRRMPPIPECRDGEIVTLRVTVQRHIPAPRRGRPYRVLCSGEGGTLALVFFHAKGDYLEKLLPVGAERVVSGRVDYFNGQLQMPHPDHVVTPEEAASIAVVEPQYGLTAGITPKVMAKAVAGALKRLPRLPEWQDEAWLKRQQWTDWAEAVRQAHAPESMLDLSPEAKARQRLAYDELLANQLALAIIRRREVRKKGRCFKASGELQGKVEAALPFRLTGAQAHALAEIAADMASDDRMVRLLQGDVGSGKTVVALMAMLIAVEAGAQAALLAPTEILARQHHERLAELAEAAGVRVALLTGRDKGKAREALLADLKAGAIDILIGTHAIIEGAVAFHDLGLAVIDEQHRFGVHQRLLLAEKGQKPVDLLVMTATPIPRTLTLTAYGDMDVSRITEKPPGRQPVDTRVLPLSRLPEAEAAAGRAITEGRQIYWICPLVAESESVDLAAAQERAAALAKRFGDTVGLVHGRMKGVEKDAVMAAFQAGDIRILVSTTVVEVGVDVPNASIMFIEHAERFGLAQLHQLRGRIGRGSARSTCLLMYHESLSETAKRRLAILRETEDGFRIAEEDLKLRGGGEVLGTRQSGMPEFRLADVSVHGDLLAAARDDARLILERDPSFKTERGRALLTLLYLFERDAAIGYLQSG